MHRELWRIDSVCEVQPKIGQIRGARSHYIERTGSQRGHCALKLWILFHSCGLNIGVACERRRSARIGERVIGVRVWEQEHGKIETSLFALKLCIREVSFPLLLLQLCFDQISMGSLTRVLSMLGQIRELVCLIESPLRNRYFVVCGKTAVVQANYRDNQSAPRNLQFC
jgi:hypothetical protein